MHEVIGKSLVRVMFPVNLLLIKLHSVAICVCGPRDYDEHQRRMEKEKITFSLATNQFQHYNCLSLLRRKTSSYQGRTSLLLSFLF